MGPRLVVATRVWDGTGRKSALHFYRISHDVPGLELGESDYFNRTIRALELSTQRVSAQHTKGVVNNVGFDQLMAFLNKDGAFNVDEKHQTTLKLRLHAF